MKTVRLGDLRAHEQQLIEALKIYADREMETRGKVRPVVVATSAGDVRVGMARTPKAKAQAVG